MKILELRQQIDRNLEKLSVEQLVRVSDFLASLPSETEIVEPEDSHQPLTIRRATPIRRGKQAKDLLELAGTWVGDDVGECLEVVRQDRPLAQF